VGAQYLGQLVRALCRGAPDFHLTGRTQLGDPFTHRLADEAGDVGLDWGVYGVPETFIIDRSGVVRYKHVGPLAPSDLDEILLPIIDELTQEPA